LEVKKVLAIVFYLNGKVTCDFRCGVETKEFFKDTGRHLQCKSNNSEMAQGSDVTAGH